ncbi:hypothetical protein LJY25_07785 [Hymenobacter sp. BT175]|uniref:hypothetical protein n=1 Tax=Hymenobacter translucens TaxID=2886507 RepID=UPI001D0E1901|nr:hypothetical protein [Hymenobacter translucens]MCC2546341.1 hypothetical protein [Hymenobacter translucens]
MRRFRNGYLILILLASPLLLSGFRQNTSAYIISGHLRKNPSDPSWYIEGVNILVKDDNEVLAKNTTDSKGDFELILPSVKGKHLDFFATGLGIDTLLIASIEKSESSSFEMTFYIPGVIKRNVLTRVVCPKCKRSNHVYEIWYGDAPVVTTRVSKSGATTYSPIYKGKYQGSCIVQPASYYCDRDKLKF